METQNEEQIKEKKKLVTLHTGYLKINLWRNKKKKE
jgi:hypothetical protein